MRRSSLISPENEREFDLNSVFKAEDYLFFYDRMINEDSTWKEIDYLVRELRLIHPMKILDLACGHGRHAHQLGRLGYEVTGLDSNIEFLDIAKRNAEGDNIMIQYHCGDTRTYQSPETFDRIIHLFSSFGYFPDDENEQVLLNVASSLKKGGLFCFDILNRDAFLKDFPRYGVYDKDGDLMIDRNRFDPLSGRLYNDRIIIRNGMRRDLPFYLRLYNSNEILRLLKNAGLKVQNIHGDWDAKVFNNESRRMIFIAEKV